MNKAATAAAEQLRALNSPHRLPGPAEATPAAGVSPFVEYLVLFAFFAGWAGFWIAVIWWIVAAWTAH